MDQILSKLEQLEARISRLEHLSWQKSSDRPRKKRSGASEELHGIILGRYPSVAAFAREAGFTGGHISRICDGEVEKVPECIIAGMALMLDIRTPHIKNLINQAREERKQQCQEKS